MKELCTLPPSLQLQACSGIKIDVRDLVRAWALPKKLWKNIAALPWSLNFIDDIIVFGRDEAEHQTKLDHVLEVLKSYSVTLNMKKCIFGAKIVQFLGHELSAEGVKPLM